MNFISRTKSVVVFLLLLLFCGGISLGVTYKIYPAIAGSGEDFETIANSLKPGDELILYGGTYSQTARRAVTVRGTAGKSIIIRAAEGQKPLLTHPADCAARYNNIEFIDCEYLTIRGIYFKGGSSGVRFIRGNHITFEDCRISHTQNNALTMNSGDCDAFVIRRNHIHHTGLSTRGSTEGEGMYIGGHDGSCITTNTLVEGNVIWNAGEGIQVVSDAVIRNNIIFDCSMTGITAAPHAAVPHVRNVKIVNNTIVNHPRGILFRWEKAEQMIFANNAVYCPGSTAIDAAGIDGSTFSANYVTGRLVGTALDGAAFCDGGTIDEAFAAPAEHDYWPGPGSVLINHADSNFAAGLDFNNNARKPPFDVGAYESEKNAANPGWRIKEGFKVSQ